MTRTTPALLQSQGLQVVARTTCWRSVDRDSIRTLIVQTPADDAAQDRQRNQLNQARPHDRRLAGAHALHQRGPVAMPMGVAPGGHRYGHLSC